MSRRLGVPKIGTGDVVDVSETKCSRDVNHDNGFVRRQGLGRMALSSAVNMVAVEARAVLQKSAMVTLP